MDTNTIIGIVGGGIIGCLISWYFYSKGKQKVLLTPYLQFHSKIFSDIEPELKRDLKITYRDITVNNLHQLQFIIINNGNKPIKDIIDPLRFLAPNGFEILDSKIVQISPEGRVIMKRKVASNALEFNIPLLNSKEFFKVKLLLKCGEDETSVTGKNDIVKQSSFKITADDLPPILKIGALPDYFSLYNFKTGSWFQVIAGICMVLQGSTLFWFQKFKFFIIMSNKLAQEMFFASYLLVLIGLILITVHLLKSLTKETNPLFRAIDYYGKD